MKIRFIESCEKLLVMMCRVFWFVVIWNAEFVSSVTLYPIFRDFSEIS